MRKQQMDIILSWLLLPSTWMRAGIQCWGNEAEQRLREGLCHSLSLVSLVREAESPKMADMIRHGCWGKDYDHLAQEGVSCGQRLASDRCLSNSSCLFCWETTRRKNSERKTWVPRKIWQRILLSKQPAIGTTLEWLRHNYREHCKY